MHHLKNYGLTLACMLGGTQVQAVEIVYGQSYNPAASAQALNSRPVQGTMEEKIQQIEARLGLAQSLDKDKTYKDPSGRIVWEYKNVEVADHGYRFSVTRTMGTNQYGTEKMNCIDESNRPGYNPNKLTQCGGLMGVNLSSIDLSGGIDLRGASLSTATMRCTNLQGGQLQGAQIYGADLSGLNRDCSSTDAFKNTTVHAATHFEGARLSKSSLQMANLNSSILTNVEAMGTNFKDATLENSQLSGNYSGAKFINANLRGAHMNEMNAKGADFRSADFRGSTFSGLIFDNTTDFTGAKFDINHPENLPFSACYAIMLGMLPYNGEEAADVIIEDFYGDATPESIIMNGYGRDFTTPDCKLSILGEAPVPAASTDSVVASASDEQAQDERKPERKVWFTNLLKDSKIVGATLEN